MIGNRGEEAWECTIILRVIRKSRHPVRIDWQQFWPEKSQSPSRDSNPDCPGRMPALYHLCHHHFHFRELLAFNFTVINVKWHSRCKRSDWSRSASITRPPVGSNCLIKAAAPHPTPFHHISLENIKIGWLIKRLLLLLLLLPFMLRFLFLQDLWNYNVRFGSVSVSQIVLDI